MKPGIRNQAPGHTGKGFRAQPGEFHGVRLLWSQTRLWVGRDSVLNSISLSRTRSEERGEGINKRRKGDVSKNKYSLLPYMRCKIRELQWKNKVTFPELV